MKGITMDKILLKKYCNNRCTEAELNTIIEWFQVSAGTREGEALLFKFGKNFRRKMKLLN
jgi:hypothetical protein